MIKEEVWSLPMGRARAFFREQSNVTEETPIQRKPTGMGIWVAKRIQVRMEGEDADVETICHRYFIPFLPTGG